MCSNRNLACVLVAIVKCMLYVFFSLYCSVSDWARVQCCYRAVADECKESCLDVCTHSHTHTHTHTRTHTHTHTHTLTLTHSHPHTHTPTYMHVFVHVHPDSHMCLTCTQLYSGMISSSSWSTFQLDCVHRTSEVRSHTLSHTHT